VADFAAQEEDFDEDEGIYDDLNLDEQEEVFGIGHDDQDSDSESGSDNEGMSLFTFSPACLYSVDAIPRASSKEATRKGTHDDESVASSRKDEVRVFNCIESHLLIVFIAHESNSETTSSTAGVTEYVFL